MQVVCSVRKRRAKSDRDHEEANVEPESEWERGTRLLGGEET